MGSGFRHGVPSRDVEPHESLSRAWDTRNEDDRLTTVGPRVHDDLLDTACGLGQVLRPGVVAGDVVHRVPAVHRPGGFDDGRGGRVGRCPPTRGVERWSVSSRPQREADRRREAVRVRLERAANAVCVRWAPSAIRPHGPGGTKDRENWRLVARLVEILQIEPVVPRLLEVRPQVSGGPDLELDRDDDTLRNEHGVDPLPEARDVELEVDPARGTQEGRAQNRQLVLPRARLLGLEREAARAGECPEDRVVRGEQKVGHRGRVPGGVPRGGTRGLRHAVGSEGSTCARAYQVWVADATAAATGAAVGG